MRCRLALFAYETLNGKTSVILASCAHIFTSSNSLLPSLLMLCCLFDEQRMPYKITSRLIFYRKY